MSHHIRLRAANKQMKALGDGLLRQAALILDASADFDTAVRDGVSTGLAYLVHAGYDSIACSMNIDNTEAWMAFIDNATAEWFRQRGFAEWFCLAAASQFNSSRPRTLAERNARIVKRHVYRPRKKKAA